MLVRGKEGEDTHNYSHVLLLQVNGTLEFPVQMASSLPCSKEGLRDQVALARATEKAQTGWLPVSEYAWSFTGKYKVWLKKTGLGLGPELSALPTWPRLDRTRRSRRIPNAKLAFPFIIKGYLPSSGSCGMMAYIFTLPLVCK